MPPIRRQVTPGDADASEIRSVESAPRPRRQSGPRSILPSVPPATNLAFSSVPPASMARARDEAEGAPETSSVPLSRDERMQQKLALAERLLRQLGSQDSRARLLQVAVMRGDEGLLDAILASLDPAV